MAPRAIEAKGQEMEKPRPPVAKKEPVERAILDETVDSSRV